VVVIIDYGVGNLASMKNMFRKIGVEALISSNPTQIEQADKLVLPGVGAFDTCASKLQESGLVDLVNYKVLVQKTPVLGVCVGMQLLTSGSEEGQLPGLNWIEGKIIRFQSEKMPVGSKIPHMGWTDVTPVGNHLLFAGIQQPRFYFVHSYHPQLDDNSNVLVKAHYGYDFTAGMQKGHIMGVQFHPEKSHKFGMQLLDNFTRKF
jgi:imidazole glycerol-phosphate synthase subunit HisH